jgi:hypothetical protein
MEEKCKICGCTDTNACEGGCYWVAEELCSKCLDKVLQEHTRLNQDKELLIKYLEEKIKKIGISDTDLIIKEYLQDILNKIKGVK